MGFWGDKQEDNKPRCKLMPNSVNVETLLS